MEMSVSLKQALNNDIVLMRHLIRQAKVHIIHKVTRNVKTLKQKKGNDNVKEKFEKKAERLIEEILAIKNFNNVNISKQILLETRNGNIILSDINSTTTDRALAKIMTFKTVSEKIKEIRDKYPETLINEFLKNSNNRTKNSKKNKKGNKGNEKCIENSNNISSENSVKSLSIENALKNSKKTEIDEGIIFKKSKKTKRKADTDTEIVLNTSKTRNLEKEIVLNKSKKNKEKKSIHSEEEDVSSDGDAEIVKSKKKQKERCDKAISNKSKRNKEKENIVSEEQDVSSDGEETIVKSKKNQKEKDDKAISNKSKRKKEMKNIESGEDVSSDEDEEIDKSKKKQKERDNKSISNKSKRKKEMKNIESEQEDVSNDGDEEIVKSKKKQKDKLENVISYQSKRKKEKINSETGDISNDEIKIYKKSKENNKSKIVEESVDPFFLMSNGQDEYLSIVKTTSDEVTNKQQNRTYTDNLNRRQRRQLQKNGGTIAKRKFSDKATTNRSSFMNIDPIQKFSNDNKKLSNNVRTHSITDQVEKLHPSWQAKLVQKPSVVKFEGKKIVFD